MSLPVTLKDIIPNLREVTVDMPDEEKVAIYNENIKILLENMLALEYNIKEVNENG